MQPRFSCHPEDDHDSLENFSTEFFLSPQDIHRKIALELYGDEEKYKTVENIVSVASLPKEAMCLIKTEEELSERSTHHSGNIFFICRLILLRSVGSVELIVSLSPSLFSSIIPSLGSWERQAMVYVIVAGLSTNSTILDVN